MSAREAHNEAFETARGTVVDMIQTMKNLAGCTLAAVAFCLALAPAVAWADVDPEASLTKVDGEDAVAVSLIAPDAPRDVVHALSLSLNVTGIDPSKTSVSFKFDDSLSSVSVKDARVVEQQGTYRVNLYVAGNTNLYANDQITLGKVVFTDADNATAEVSVDPSSLQLVNAAHTRSVPSFYAGQPASVELGKAPEPSNPDTPDNPDTPSTGDDNKDDGDHNNTGDNNNGNNTNDTSGSNPDANRSPGAPSGTDNSPVPTGDNLTGIVAALAASLALAAVALVIVFVRRSRTH